MSTSHRIMPVMAGFLCYALIVVLCAPFGAAATTNKNPRKPAISTGQASQRIAASRPGEVLVRFREGVSLQAQDVLLATHGARRQKALRGESRVEKVELPAGQDPFTAAAQLRLNPQVQVAEPNFLVEKSDLTPNDPSFDEQWALNNTGQNGGQFGSDIDATAAWQTTTGSQSTIVAVIDSGVDFFLDAGRYKPYLPKERARNRNRR